MAEGSDTWKGLGVPLNGNFEIKGISTTLDIMTITQVSAGGGDFLVLQTAGGGELFVINSLGSIEGSLTVVGNATVGEKLTVSSGGLTITDGSVVLTTGSITLTAGALTLSGAGKKITQASGGIDITDGSIAITAGSITVSAGALKMVAGDIVMTAGALELTAGPITHTSGDHNMTKGDIKLTAGNLTVSPDYYVKFSTPIATAPSAVTRGDLFVIMKSDTPQIGIAYSTSANLIYYITADTKTMGRVTA